MFICNNNLLNVSINPDLNKIKIRIASSFALNACGKWHFITNFNPSSEMKILNKNLFVPFFFFFFFSFFSHVTTNSMGDRGRFKIEHIIHKENGALM